MSSVASLPGPVRELVARAGEASTDDERAACVSEIDAALGVAHEPVLKAYLYISRARARDSHWDATGVLEDALAAMDLFEEAGVAEGALDAASLAAARAARLGELSLAVELATRCICSLGSLGDDNLTSDVATRLGMFCCSFLDYDRAVEQFYVALDAAERTEAPDRLMRALHDVADALLLAVRQDRAAGQGDGCLDRYGADRLAQAEEVVHRLQSRGSEDDRSRAGAHRLQAELLLERGRPAEALDLLRAHAVLPGPTTWAAGASAHAAAEARALRALGRATEAVAVATRARELAGAGRDAHEILLVLDELVAAEQEAGLLAQATADAIELKRLIWVAHRGQTAQMVDQIWARAALEAERKALEAQTAAAMRSAEQDALTRIGNRRLLERALAELARTGGRLSLLMADIDHFKRINDTFGHELGDHVLRSLGSLLASDARSGQTVVRYGGEEFVFVLPGVELASAHDFAERARARVGNYPWADLDPRLQVTVSIGVASGASRDWSLVLAAADRALYLAKQRGRNRVEASAEVALAPA